MIQPYNFVIFWSFFICWLETIWFFGGQGVVISLMCYGPTGRLGAFLIRFLKLLLRFWSHQSEIYTNHEEKKKEPVLYWCSLNSWSTYSLVWMFKLPSVEASLFFFLSIWAALFSGYPFEELIHAWDICTDLSIVLYA